MHRRDFLIGSVTAGASLCLKPRTLFGQPFGLPIGLQLYSVHDLLAEDYQRTLTRIAAIGYKEVELAFPSKPGAEIRKAIAHAGLACPSVHYRLRDVMRKTESILAEITAIGAKYLIVPGPEVRDPSRLHLTGDMVNDAAAYRDGITVDDWRWSGEQMNRLGRIARESGITIGYHNHNLDFKSYGGVIAYDALAEATDPSLVVLELDTGWVAAAGANPADYLYRYAHRIRMLHIKDFAHFTPSYTSEPARAAELGRGVLDIPGIFKAARQAGIQHYFIEQESFEIPVMEALKLDYDYVRALPA